MFTNMFGTIPPPVALAVAIIHIPKKQMYACMYVYIYIYIYMRVHGSNDKNRSSDRIFLGSFLQMEDVTGCSLFILF